MTHGSAVSATTDRRRLWLGLLLAPSGWLIVEGVGYVVASRLCALGVLAADNPRALGPRIVQLAICAAGATLTLIGLWIAVRNVHALAGGDDATSPAGGRARFMAVAGVIMSVLFTGSVVLFTLPAFILDACHRARS